MKEAAVARFDTRMPKKEKEFFEYAANLGGYKTLAAFFMHAARVEAERIVEKHNVILASERDAKIFFDALMNPPEPNEALKKAAKRYKRLVAEKK